MNRSPFSRTTEEERFFVIDKWVKYTDQGRKPVSLVCYDFFLKFKRRIDPKTVKNISAKFLDENKIVDRRRPGRPTSETTQEIRQALAHFRSSKYEANSPLNTSNPTCDNCSKLFPATSPQVLCVQTYTVGQNGRRRSIFEGLQLLFKSRHSVTRAELNPKFDDIKFCVRCASQFQELMTCHATFLRSSKTGSYVSNLQNEVSQHFKRSRGINVPIMIDKAQTLREHSPRTVRFVPRKVPEFQESSDDLQSSEHETITADPLQDYNGTTMKNENSEVSINSFIFEDPLFIPSSSISITDLHSTTPKSSSPVIVPNKKPARERKQNLKNRSEVISETNNDNTFLDTASSLPFASPCEVRFPENTEPDFCVRNQVFPTITADAIQETMPSSRGNCASDATRPFTCLNCNTGFRREKDLRRHNREKHGAPVVLPPTAKDRLTEEQKALIDFNKFMCDGPDCKTITFSSFKEWVLHQENIHKLDTGYEDYMDKPGELVPKHEKIRPCPMCGKKCYTDYNTIKHLKTVHLKMREFGCEVCGKNFATKASLQGHMKIMHSETPVSRDFLCTYCGEAFKLKGSLTTHESIHLEVIQKKEKKYACDLCEKRYDKKYRLTQHKLTHIEQKNFACDQCGATFKCEQFLKNHKSRQHTDKPLNFDEVCELCGKRYAFKVRLKEHLVLHHKLDKEEARVLAKMKRSSLFRVLPNGDRIFKEQPTKPKTCYICHRTYVRRDNLYTHLVSAHGKSEEEAKNITGLETKRDLFSAKSGAKTRRIRQVQESLGHTSGNEAHYPVLEDEDDDGMDEDVDDYESGEENEDE